MEKHIFYLTLNIPFNSILFLSTNANKKYTPFGVDPTQTKLKHISKYHTLYSYFSDSYSGIFISHTVIRHVIGAKNVDRMASTPL